MELFSGPQYLAIDIANNFGKDKEIYEVRLDWFDQEVLPIINNDASLNKLVKEADSPALMVQGIYAYRSYMHKEPVYYPVSFDAVASGIQINSTLTRCERGMLLTGILPTYRRPSPYLTIHEELEKNGLKLDLDYETTKAMVMRKNYGSEATARNILKDPEKVSLFDKVMYEMLPGATLLNQAIIKLWDTTAFNYKWVMPDNFHVFVEVKDTYGIPIMDNSTFTNIELSMPENWGRSLSPNFTHSQTYY